MLKPVMLSTRGQNGPEAKIFGLGLKHLASTSKLWPRPQTFGLGLASISSYYVIGHFSGKNRIKFGNFVNFSSSSLNRMLIIICHCLHHLLLVAKSINYALRDVGHGLLIDHVTSELHEQTLIECYSVIAIECQPTSSCLRLTLYVFVFIFVFLMF